MSNAELIERLYGAGHNDIMAEAAEALALADKRIAELAKFHAELHVEHGKAKIRIGELECKLAVAREAMTKASALECNGAIRVALAQIGGEDAS